MQRNSPPKHRHDGTSPLPLGMDWSPPPRKWSGRDTVWPHDPRSGWSYCVTVPSWTVLPKSRESDPVVFYRVQIGIQSPEGLTATRGVLRRFNDFLKLFGALRKAFPRKNLPPAPPKGLLRLKSNTLLEERRCSLAAWMEKLLSDIDISRSVAVASFLELEAAARSSFQDEKQSITESTLSVNKPVAGSGSLTSDYGSDTVYEASEIGTSSLGRDNGSEPGMDDLSLDQDLTDPIERLVKYGMSNIDEGLFMGQAILEQLEGLPRHKANAGEINKVAKGNNGNASRGPYFSPDSEDSQVIHHARKLSSESVGSEVSSLKGSESSNTGPSNALGDGSLDLFPRGSEVYKNPDILGTELLFPNDVKLVLPLDHRQKMNRLLITMQRRLVTAKTDMEDLISRLNQEIAVKDYLTAKVKDLEVELETTKQRSKENLQQAISIERERYTQMQWDMEELKRKSFEMELKLNSQSKNPDTEPTKGSTGQGKDELMQELDATKQQLIDLQKQHQELEAKSKSDIKVLVKEVKSLRNSQAEYKQQLNQSLKEKSEAEKLLQQEKQNTKNTNTARRKLLNECEVLRSRLQECHVNLLHEDKLVQDSSSLTAAFDLLTLSDNRINLLLSEAQLVAKDDEDGVVSTAETVDFVDDGAKTTDHELREMLRNIVIDNTRLRKQVNSIMHYALKRDTSSDKIDDDQAPSEHFIQNESIER